MAEIDSLEYLISFAFRDREGASERERKDCGDEWWNF